MSTLLSEACQRSWSKPEKLVRWGQARSWVRGIRPTRPDPSEVMARGEARRSSGPPARAAQEAETLSSIPSAYRHHLGGCLHFMGFPGGSAVKNLPANAGDAALIPGSGKIPWRKKWQPTPVFLPGKFHGQRSLTGYSLCDASSVASVVSDSLRSH